MRDTTATLLTRTAERFLAVADDRGEVCRLSNEVKRGHPLNTVVHGLCDRFVNAGNSGGVRSVASEVFDRYDMTDEPLLDDLSFPNDDAPFSNDRVMDDRLVNFPLDGDADNDGIRDEDDLDVTRRPVASPVHFSGDADGDGVRDADEFGTRTVPQPTRVDEPPL